MCVPGWKDQYPPSVSDGCGEPSEAGGNEIAPECTDNFELSVESSSAISCSDVMLPVAPLGTDMVVAAESYFRFGFRLTGVSAFWLFSGFESRTRFLAI